MLRGVHEPFNYNRRIIGFDTFAGFPSVSLEDGSDVKQGDYSVTAGWKNDLEKILSFHEQNAPIPHKKKFAALTRQEEKQGLLDNLELVRTKRSWERLPESRELKIGGHRLTRV